MLQVAANSATIPAEKTFRVWLNKLSQSIDINHKELTIRVVEVAESQQLNHQFRHQNKPTNVLSFPSHLPEIATQNYLGDIVICADIIEHEALAQNKSNEAHWAHMLVHGILHLQGFDHIDDPQAVKMEALEVSLLAKLGYPDPYA